MKNNLLLILLVTIVSLFTIGCSQGQSEAQKKASYQTISTEIAKKRLDTEKDIVLLDVRTVAENTEKRIPGSVLIPVGDIKPQAPEKLKDKDAAIVIYCRSGNRSITAAKALTDMGYTNVYNLGGINKWPYETETGKSNKNFN